MSSTMCQERLTWLTLKSMEWNVRRFLDMEVVVVALAEAQTRKQQI